MWECTKVNMMTGREKKNVALTTKHATTTRTNKPALRNYSINNDNERRPRWSANSKCCSALAQQHDYDHKCLSILAVIAIHKRIYWMHFCTTYEVSQYISSNSSNYNTMLVTFFSLFCCSFCSFPLLAHTRKKQNNVCT